MIWVPEEGAISCENWQAALAGAPALDAFEFPVFSDVDLAGEITEGFGPYQLFNALSGSTHEPSVPAAFLRLQYHLHLPPLDMAATQADRYHGGYIQDELVALLALSFGLRLKAGGATRWFPAKGDPRGRPWSFKLYAQSDPIFIPATHGAILPTAPGQRTLFLPELLARFPELVQQDSVVLVRAARLYQEAIWLAESTPALAWLLLVSAIETAAGHWRSRRESPIERMRASRPQLEPLLHEAGGDNLVSQVAEMMAPYMGATKTFIDFVLEFLPEPPAVRPPEFAQHSWDSSALKKTVKTIYSLRSQALHGGNPFPAPMCMPPHRFEDGYEEKPIGTAAGALGSVWVAKDIPMLLHTFAYLARGALLNWWSSLHHARGGREAQPAA